MIIRRLSGAFAALAFSALVASPALAAKCGGDFNTFVAAMGRDAAAAGVSQGVISEALSGNCCRASRSNLAFPPLL